MIFLFGINARNDPIYEIGQMNVLLKYCNKICLNVVFSVWVEY
jgi:hypothetical protein